MLATVTLLQIISNVWGDEEQRQQETKRIFEWYFHGAHGSLERPLGNSSKNKIAQFKCQGWRKSMQQDISKGSDCRICKEMS